MAANAQQLTAFVNNILNVACIDDDQMELHLVEEQWPTIREHHRRSKTSRQGPRRPTPDHYRARPTTVAVDRLSIQEVITT